jgi:hypothetical protein
VAQNSAAILSTTRSVRSNQSMSMCARMPAARSTAEYWR